MPVHVWLRYNLLRAIHLNVHAVRGIIILRAELSLDKARLLVCLLIKRAELLVETRADVSLEYSTRVCLRDTMSTLVS